MRLLIIAVGKRMPAWADSAASEFRKRLGRSLPLEVLEVTAERRHEGHGTVHALEAERRRIEALIPPGCRCVALDEKGQGFSTRAFAQRLQSWFNEGRDTAFLIGGPDGLASELKARADLMMQLSSFTLPHALARVVLLEQIYRARTLLDNHPYHRE